MGVPPSPPKLLAAIRVTSSEGVFRAQIVVPAKISILNRKILAFDEASASQFVEKQYPFPRKRGRLEENDREEFANMSAARFLPTRLREVASAIGDRNKLA
jgi:hypothetical protein